MPTNTTNSKEEEEIALRQVLATLDVQKKAMENEADAIYLELTTPPGDGIEPMGIDTPLVDQDGYPRGDIDVYRARAQRNRFRVLQTDHKKISEKIEGLLLQFAALKDPSKADIEAEERALRLSPKPKPKYDTKSGKWVVMNWDGTVAGVEKGEQIKFKDLTRDISDVTEPTFGSGSDTMSSIRTTSLRELTTAMDALIEGGSVQPFARVDAVAEDSPAKGAGLKVDDLIYQFGHIHADNHERLKALASLVPSVAGDGGSITIQLVRRPGEEINNSQTTSMSAGQQTTDETTMAVATPEEDYNNPNKWEKVTLSLKPRPWSGRGLIGCHIVPFNP